MGVSYKSQHQQLRIFKENIFNILEDNALVQEVHATPAVFTNRGQQNKIYKMHEKHKMWQNDTSKIALPLNDTLIIADGSRVVFFRREESDDDGLIFEIVSAVTQFSTGEYVKDKQTLLRFRIKVSFNGWPIAFEYPDVWNDCQNPELFMCQSSEDVDIDSEMQIVGYIIFSTLFWMNEKGNELKSIGPRTFKIIDPDYIPQSQCVSQLDNGCRLVLSKSNLMTFQEGHILTSNVCTPDGNPVLTTIIGPLSERNDLWEKVKNLKCNGRTCTVHADMWSSQKYHS